MAKNTGKPSEREFEAHFDRKGKQAFYYRIPDAAEVYGRVGSIGLTRPAPSDYVLVFDGVTSFAEVKSTQSKTSFPFSILRTPQSAAAKQVLAAGGTYDVYLHDLTHNHWFKIPYSHIQSVKDAGKASIPWADLVSFLWEI